MEVRITAKPLISILMPCKDAGLFLVECLDSILNQTLCDWELIVIDDHSKDDSSSILNKFSKQDKRIRCFLADGVGIIPALKQAYKLSRGEFITRMDADDVMFPEKLKTLVSVLEQSGPGFVSTACVEYFGENLGLGYPKYAAWLNDLRSSLNPYSEIYKECVLPSPCWMVACSDLDLAGAFDSDVYPEDYDLCFRFYMNGIKIKSSKEVLHKWRDHSDRTTRTNPLWKDQSFLSLKLHYFLKKEHDDSKPLIVWGAGRKGKELVRLIQKAGYEPRWVCDNANKQGKDIYGVIMESSLSLKDSDEGTVIVVVAQRLEVENIKFQLEQKGFVVGKDCYFFV